MPPGFKRSRALWDDARRPGAPTMAVIRAIAYELQPIRFSTIDSVSMQIKAITHAQYSISAVRTFTMEALPAMTHSTSKMLHGLSRQTWMVVGGILVYGYTIRAIHEAMDAGPLVLIISALIAIFTIGLGNNVNKDGVSAYSVFNRGFKSIMGSVDVEALVQQHVGGAMGVMHMDQRRVDDDDDEPPARRRQQQQHRQIPELVQADNNNNDDDNDHDDNNNRPRPRKSGKKARRGNLEQRRELQRQRQAALAMGFGGDDGGHDEQLAMQMILEEQIAANAARGNHE